MVEQRKVNTNWVRLVTGGFGKKVGILNRWQMMGDEPVQSFLTQESLRLPSSDEWVREPKSSSNRP